jgi:hypothetical protein
MNQSKIWFLIVPLAMAALPGCGGDDDDSGAGTGGEAGQGGSSSGSGGKGGSSGSSGSSGKGGSGAMPRGKENPPTLGAQIDRMGRPAINTALNQAFNADTDEKDAEKDAYNAASDPADWSAYTEAFETSLGILDALDAECGNQLLAGTGDTPYGALAGVLIDDQLYVNTDKGTCGAYLGVEAEALGLVEDGSCGGRTPSYDVIETSYSVLAAGALSGVDDTIAEDDMTHDEDTFPFLAGPQ